MATVWRWWNEPVYVVSKCLGRLIEAFFVIGLCGACGVLIDLDHVLVLLVKGIPLTWENLARQAGRPFHIPAVVVCGVLCLIGHTRLHRLLARDSEITRKIVKVR